MSSRVVRVCVLLLCFGFGVMHVMAQTAEAMMTPAEEPTQDLAGQPVTETPVVQYNLEGPRIGVTLMPNGLGPRSQFGWHFENQAAPGSRGPWFLVERIFLVGGVERGEFIPSGTLVFGVRTPSGFEIGLGPSATIGPSGFTTAVVVAAGQSLRYGGIRVPINLAVAMSQRENVTAFRFSLITGWAIRQNQDSGASPPYRYGLER